MIKAIIFDFFDVLRTDGFNRWLKKRGLKREGAYLVASERHDRGELTDAEYFQSLSDISGEAAAEIEREMETGNVLNSELVTFVATLQGKYKIALLSNSASEYLRNELRKYDLEKYFDLIVISSEIGLIKPEPEVFQYITGKLGVSPSECIFIDDNPKHVTAAEKLGITGLVYTDMSSLKEQLAALHL